MFRKDRIRKKGGGLLVYVADRVKASRILDLEDDYVESLYILLLNAKFHQNEPKECVRTNISRNGDTQFQQADPNRSFLPPAFHQ